MGAIIAYVHNKKTFFACDSKNNFIRQYSLEESKNKRSKVQEMPNNILFSVAVCNLKIKLIISSHPEWFENLGDDNILTKEKIVKNIIPKLYKALTDEKIIDKDSVKRGEPNYSGSIILAQEDRLFLIDDDFSVYRIPKYCIIGSTNDYVYARVESYNGEIPIDEMLYKAMKESERCSGNIEGPYFLYETGSAEVKILGE